MTRASQPLLDGAKGVEAQTTYFVPLGESLEIWKLTLTNQRSEPAHLSVFSSIEFCLWDAQDDAANFQRNFSTAEVEVDGSTIYHKTEYRERRNHYAYYYVIIRRLYFFIFF